MENNQQNTPDQEPAKPYIPPPGQEPKQNDETEENSGAKTQAGNYLKYEAPTVIVNNIQKDKLTIANIISIASVLVSGALFYYTFCLFKQAQIQSVAATKAANAAESSIGITKAYDSASLANQDTSFNKNYNLSKGIADSTNDNNRKILEFYRQSLKISTNTSKQNLELSHQALQTQIDAIKSSENNFTLENEPYLQMSKIVLDTFEVGKKMVVNFQIENLGKYPAKIISDSSNSAICINHPNLDDLKNFSYGLNQNIESYIIKESPIKIQYSSDTLSMKDSILMAGKYYIFFIGRIKYKNLVSGKERIYRYAVKIKVAKGEGADYIENENEDVEISGNK